MHKSLAQVAFLGLLLGLTACEEEVAAVAPVIRPVRTVVIEPQPIADNRMAVGEIRPRQETDLSFQVSGKLIARPVDVGATVTKGDLLARLDEQDYRNKLRSAEADLVAAEATAAEARSTEMRQRQLMASGTTTRANYDVALKNLRSAEAMRDSSRAASAMATDQLAYTGLAASLDGIVTAVGAEAGQVVNVGQMIVRLAPPSEKDAVFSVAEAMFQDRAVDDRPQVTVSLLSNPEISVQGVVREVSPIADPETRTYQVKATLAEAPPQMMFGASVAVRLRESPVDAVVLPGSAIFDQAGKPAVWLYQAASKSVTLKPVAIASYETDRVIIAEGLVKGDIVVTAGVNRLREGQEVRLSEAQ